MKKLLYVGLGLITLIIAASLIIPLFVDPNQYKTDIEEKFQASTGYKLDIKGGISMSLFPIARAKINNVTLSNNSKTLADIEQIVAYPKLLPLFSGDVKIDSIKIEKPEIFLEKNDKGFNWDKIEAAKPKEPEVKNTAKESEKSLDLKIDSIKIAHGTVNFADNVKNKKYVFKEIKVDSALGSLAGPVDFDVSLKYNELPVTAKGSVKNFDKPEISLQSNLMGTKISFEGILENGEITVKSSDLSPLAEFFNVQQIKHLAQLPVDISAGINYSKEKIDLRHAKLLIGETKGEGDLSVGLNDETDIKADMKFQNVNLDQLLPKKDGKPAAPGDKKPQAEEATPPKDMNLALNLLADSLTYKGAQYKNLVVNSSVEDNDIVLKPLSLGVPGGGKMEVFGVISKDTKGRVFEGHASIDSQNPREFLQAYKVNVGNIKPGVLKNLNFDSEVVVNVRQEISAVLSKIALKFDDTNFNGNISANLADIPSIEINGTIDKVNVNNYIDTKKPPATKEEIRQSGPTDDKPFQIGWLEEFPVKGSLNLSLNELIYREDSGNIRLKMDFAPENIKINELSLATKKIQMAAKGVIYAVTGKKPKIDMEANIGKINLADFTKEDNSSPVLAKPPAPKPQNKNRWSQEPIDLSALRKLDMDFTVNIASLAQSGLVFDNINVKGYIEKGSLILEKFSSDLFGGKINLTGNIAASAVPAFAIGASAVDIDVFKLLDALAGNQRARGKISFTSNMSSSGIHQLAMISNLKGNVSVASTDMMVKGFDLEGLSAQLTNINDIAGIIGIARTVSGEQAVTYVKSVSGAVAVENGMAKTIGEGIKLDAGVGQGVYAGMADIINWNMDTNASFKMVTTDQKDRPSVGIHIYGPLDEPKKDVNLDDLKRYIADRATKLLLKNNVISDKNAELLQPGGLEKKANEEINKGLGNLLGGKKKSKDKSVPAEAPALAPAPAAPAPAAPPAASAPAAPADPAAPPPSPPAAP